MKKPIIIIIILIIVFSLLQSSYLAQTEKIDSLKKALITSKHDTTHIKILNKLSQESRVLGNYSEALKYAKDGLNISKTFSTRNNLNTAELGKVESAIYNGMANAYNNIGVVFKNQGNYPEALENFFSSLQLSKTIGYKKGIANSYLGVGNVYNEQAFYPQALEYFLKALKMFEEIRGKDGIATNLGNIAYIYCAQTNYPKALEYCLRSLKIYEELGNKNGIARNLSNIGNIYGSQANYPKASEYFFKALNIYETLRNKDGIASNLSNIGNVYSYQTNYPKALEYYFKALKMEETMGNKNGIARNLGNIGLVYKITGKFKESEIYFKNALSLSDSIGDLEGKKFWELGLSQLYDTTGFDKLAFAHYKKYIIIRDSVFNEENTNKQTRIEMTYEFEKKEAAAKAEQDKKDSLATEEKKKEKIIRYSVIVGLLLMFIIALIIYRSLRVTRKQKHIIEIKEKETQEQKYLIEEKHKEITDSINYAERIQRSLLVSSDLLKENLKEYFIYFQPKDIVSGDFYWGSSLQNNSFVFVTADSTGHGVPGAIMSILNIYCLKETIKEGISEPNEILNCTRKKIIETLKKDGTEEGGKDGMDCSLICFDFKNSKLTYSAANNPVWIVRGKEFFEFKPDKMPVGKHDKDNIPFTQHTIKLQKGDVVYTLTDGFPDQFGGEKGKKFMSKNLKELLIANAHLPMHEQKELLHETFKNWMGNLEQVDDVTVIGVRI